jgi:hypothetical protein
MHIIITLAIIAVAIFLAFIQDFGLTFLLFLMGALYFSGSLDVIYHSVTSNPYQTLGIVCCYFLIGFGWSLFKWAKYVTEYISYDYSLYCDKKSLSKIEYYNMVSDPSSDTLVEAYKRSARSDYKQKCSVLHNLNRIVSWIVTWPISLVAYLLSDFLVNLLKNLVIRLSRLYDNVVKMWVEYMLK